jgi:hypothetical protein
MIVSFFSQRTPFYQRAAVQLRADCDRLKLHHDIQPAKEIMSADPDSKVARRFVQQQKPDFIRAMLEKHRQPVWWLDVDTVIRAMPPAMPSYVFFAAHHQPHKPKYVIMSSVLYFKPMADSFKFLSDWKRQLLQGMSDHTPLVMVFKRWRHRSNGEGMFLGNFNDWVRYNGFNSVTNLHPIHAHRSTTGP